MKLGFIGNQHVHAEGLAKLAVDLGASIIGCSDCDESQWSIDAPELSLNELLESSDAIVVAGTNAKRVDAVMAAGDAGLPVLAEKPIACDTKGFQSLISRIQQLEPLVMVALPVRFSESFATAKLAIADGAIGKPLAARGTNHGQFPGGWFGELDAAGGGAVMDHTVHVSDGLCWLLDDEIQRVWCTHSNRMNLGIEVEDSGVLVFDFKSGAFASLDCSWTRPKSFHTWGDVWIEIVGTEGRIIIDPMARNMCVYDDSIGRMKTIQYSTDDRTRNMMGAFIQVARDPHSTSSPVSLRAGLHASATVLAAYESATTHQMVNLAAPA